MAFPKAQTNQFSIVYLHHKKTSHFGPCLFISRSCCQPCRGSVARLPYSVAPLAQTHLERDNMRVTSASICLTHHPQDKAPLRLHLSSEIVSNSYPYYCFILSSKILNVHLLSKNVDQIEFVQEVFPRYCVINTYMKGIQQICATLHGVLTISSDIGRFEQYRNGTYPTRPDKIN